MGIEHQALMNASFCIFPRFYAASVAQQFPFRTGTRARGPVAEWATLVPFHRTIDPAGSIPFHSGGMAMGFSPLKVRIGPRKRQLPARARDLRVPRGAPRLRDSEPESVRASSGRGDPWLGPSPDRWRRPLQARFAKRHGHRFSGGGPTQSMVCPCSGDS